jgi:hypothetical protein
MIDFFFGKALGQLYNICTIKNPENIFKHLNLCKFPINKRRILFMLVQKRKFFFCLVDSVIFISCETEILAETLKANIFGKINKLGSKNIYLKEEEIQIIDHQKAQ